MPATNLTVIVVGRIIKRFSAQGTYVLCRHATKAAGALSAYELLDSLHKKVVRSLFQTQYGLSPLHIAARAKHFRLEAPGIRPTHTFVLSAFLWMRVIVVIVALQVKYQKWLEI